MSRTVFCVSVYCAELTSTGTLIRLRAVLDREKPAHTTYELCVIEPALRVGAQARVGIDAIVAGGAPAAETGLQLGAGVLAAHSDLCPRHPRAKVNRNGPTEIERNSSMATATLNDCTQLDTTILERVNYFPAAASDRGRYDG